MRCVCLAALKSISATCLATHPRIGAHVHASCVLALCEALEQHAMAMLRPQPQHKRCSGGPDALTHIQCSAALEVLAKVLSLASTEEVRLFAQRVCAMGLGKWVPHLMVAQRGRTHRKLEETACATDSDGDTDMGSDVPHTSWCCVDHLWAEVAMLVYTVHRSS